MRPVLVIVIDTEAEFDWSKPFGRYQPVVDGLHCLDQLDVILERYRACASYVVDYSVISDPQASLRLRHILASARGDIGAHLHPWTTPPFVERLTTRNSYPGNLTASVEFRKLHTLTNVIRNNIGITPRIYKAGRYGLGPWTAMNLLRLGYEVELSVLPHYDLTRYGGPNYSYAEDRAFWVTPQHTLLELPLTSGFAGLLYRAGTHIFRYTENTLAEVLHLRGVLARIGLLERIVLTPEGISLASQKQLTKALLGRGYRLFTYSFHSSSLLPGNTPYVRDQSDLQEFLDRIDGFLDYFVGQVGGAILTVSEVARLLSDTAKTEAAAPRTERCPTRLPS